jgi:hypothetical protein
MLVTESAMNKLMESGATGARFADVEVTTTYPFRELHPDTKLPGLLGSRSQDGRDKMTLVWRAKYAWSFQNARLMS